MAILYTVYNILQSIRLSEFNQISIVMLAKVFYVLEFKVKCQTKLGQLFSVGSNSLDFSVYLMQIQMCEANRFDGIFSHESRITFRIINHSVLVWQTVLTQYY